MVAGRHHVRVSRRWVPSRLVSRSGGSFFNPPGYPPFCSENPHQTYQKIIKWEDYLQFPNDVHLSREAEDLVRRCVPSEQDHPKYQLTPLMA